MSDDERIKVRIYKDGRLMITMHKFNPYRCRESTSVSRKKAVYKNQYMTAKDYRRLLKTAHIKLWNKEYEQERCYFITLTLKEKLSLRELQNEFRRFLINVKNHYGKVEYVRAFELHEDISRFHIHTVLQFQNMPTRFDKPMAESLWKLGRCEVKRVDDIYGLLQYFTKPKEHHIQKENCYLTYFPKGAKLISCSQNFGSILSSKSYKDEYVTAEHMNFILTFHFDRYKNGSGSYVRVDGHNYFDDRSKQLNYCMDRVLSVQPKNL